MPPRRGLWRRDLRQLLELVLKDCFPPGATTTRRECPEAPHSFDAPLRQFFLGHGLEETRMDVNLAFEPPGDALLAAVLQGYDFHHGLLATGDRSEEHTSELQSQSNLVCR